MKKIKYVIEQTLEVPIEYTDKDIDECIRIIAKDRDYMWCEAHEDLFDYYDYY